MHDCLAHLYPRVSCLLCFLSRYASAACDGASHSFASNDSFTRRCQHLVRVCVCPFPLVRKARFRVFLLSCPFSLVSSICAASSQAAPSWCTRTALPLSARVPLAKPQLTHTPLSPTHQPTEGRPLLYRQQLRRLRAALLPLSCTCPTQLSRCRAVSHLGECTSRRPLTEVRKEDKERRECPPTLQHCAVLVAPCSLGLAPVAGRQAVALVLPLTHDQHSSTFTTCLFALHASLSLPHVPRLLRGSAARTERPDRWCPRPYPVVLPPSPGSHHRHTG